MSMLGNSDIRISDLAWGCWRLADDEPLPAMLDTLADCGINFIDTAAIYGFGSDYGMGLAEHLLGSALQRSASQREDWVIASKGGLDPPAPYNSSRKRLISECESSLRRLQTDYLDLYMIHRPDLLAPADEVADALNQLLRDGKVRAIGVSNHRPSQVAALAAFLDRPLAVNQVQLSAAHLGPLDDGTLDQCQQMGMTCMAWSPLAGGQLLDSATEPDGVDLAPLKATLDRIAAAHHCERADAALAFVRQCPSTVPIIGSQNPQRVRSLARAAAVHLSRREWYAIYEARSGRPMP